MARRTAVGAAVSQEEEPGGAMEMDPTIGDWGDDAVDVAVADSSFV
jgi:hypothetical protein